MASVTNAQGLGLAADQPEATGSVDSGSEAPKATYSDNLYIVQFDDAAVASYMGGKAGMAATANAATGASTLNVNSEASLAYAGYLSGNQDAFIADCEAAFGHTLNVPFKYQHVLNGMAVELTADEAATIAAMPGVKSVTRDRNEMPLTDNGPQWINADVVWDAHGWPADGSRGEGMVIAVLDTGINSAHPSYADIADDPFWHDHTNPLGSGNFIPGSYCDTVDPSFCNDKLIGAWSFVNEAVTPEDSDGHGSHTSATAGGNFISQATLFAPTTQLTRTISGVAPRANLIMYDVCIFSCPGAALLAAINQVVIDAAALPDGIHSLNYSISGGGDPYNDPVELGFLNATAAGVYVSASAGNSGPGPGTVAHLGPWVSTTAASTHNRTVENALINMTSAGPPLADIVGAGLTAGFGPADIVYAGDFPVIPNPAQCLQAFPAGTFSGEIVVCDRGAIARVQKGLNVLAGGAGGFVLANTPAQGESIVGDAHFLPGVHIGVTDGNALRAWLAANAGTTATISGFFLNLSNSNGDIMAGFSSRGPGNLNVIKPDLTAPGVNIFAAEAVGQAPAPEYQIISGTSMSSPHNAGSGALMSAMFPTWTPYEIKSALMMTAVTANTVKEDGVTPTDHFDLGAGRIDLERARRADLVMNESPINFLLADPDIGGDPRTLNLASMQDDLCIGSCSWTRTFRNVLGAKGHWVVDTSGPPGLELTHDGAVMDTWLQLHPGQSGSLTVTANTALASPGWNFGELTLREENNHQTLRLPIAVFAAQSSNPDVLNKTVDAATASEGEPLNYEVSVVNGTLAGPIDLVDTFPSGTSYVPGSASAVITNGAALSPLTVSGGQLTFSFQLDQGGLLVNAGSAPFGYFSLASLGVAPFPCPSNCDDGGFVVTVPTFQFNGAAYNQVIWSINGTLEAGTASGVASSFFAQNLPDPSIPNNIMAPLWTDLNLGGTPGGNWYVAVLSAGPDQWTVYEWENIGLFGSPSTQYTMQIWIQNTGAGGIWYVYNRIDSLSIFGTVGVENDTGTVGESEWRNGVGNPPVVGSDFEVVSSVGGTATVNFQLEIDDCDPGDAITNRADINTASTSDTAIAVTQCVP